MKVYKSDIVNWFWSKTYFEKFTNDLGFNCEDVTSSTDDEKFELYKPWVRLFKLTIN